MQTISNAEFREKYEIDRTSKRGLKAIEKTPITVKKHKFNAKLTAVGNVVFDSAKEAKRHAELLMLEKSGVITDLVSNAVLKSQKIKKIRYELEKRNGNKAWYEPDFEYIENGVKIIEDAKGYRTPEFKAKAKLMVKCHQITIKET